MPTLPVGDTPIIPALALISFILFLLWIIYIFYWILKKIGLWRFIMYRRLKRRFKGQEFDDAILDFTNDLVDKGWDYYSIKRLAKGMPQKKEILYAYFMIRKLKKVKGGIENDRVRGFEEKIERID